MEKEREEKLESEVYLVEIEKILREKFGESIKESSIVNGELLIILEKDTLLDFCNFVFRDKRLDFNYLRCLSGVDRLSHLEVVYHLFSMSKGCKMTLKLSLPRDEARVPSVVSIWEGANWHEREAHEMLGIKFERHPDLRVLLLPEKFEGYPLRKDFEVEG